MKMRGAPCRYLLLIALLVFLAACAKQNTTLHAKGTDQEIVIAILQNTALHTKAADAAFKEALVALRALKVGRPPLQVAEDIKSPLDQLDRHTVQIARPYKNEALEIENTTARAQMREGIKAIHLSYLQKCTFVRSVQEALAIQNDSKVASIMKQNADIMSTTKGLSGTIWAMIYFLEAKKALGMPQVIDEFKNELIKARDGGQS
jgi:hypothetical protein